MCVGGACAQARTLIGSEKNAEATQREYGAFLETLMPAGDEFWRLGGNSPSERNKQRLPAASRQGTV